MPRFDKAFTEDEISTIIETINHKLEQTERNGEEVEGELAALEALSEKLGHWS